MTTGPPAASGFRRLHPLTPFLRGWAWLAAAVGLGGQDALFSGDLPRLAAVAAAVAVIGLAAGALSWWFTRYGIVGGDLRVESGVVFRRSRRVRLDRLQAVDVVRPLLARLAGLAELRLEVAGGSSSEAPLAYLSQPQARALRAELLARAAGLDAATPEAPERPLVRVPFAALVWATVMSWPFIGGVGVSIALAAAAVGTGGLAFLGPLLPAALGTGAALYQHLVANFGFSLSESPDGLRIRRGLLDTRTQTVPPGRVQGVAIRRPWLWRWADRVRLDVDVAGYAGSEQDLAQVGVLLPVAPRRVALEVLRRVLPGVDVAAVPLDPAPRAARWLRPVGWPALAYGVDDAVFVTRRGRFHQVIEVVPHARTQSVRITQGPLQRLLHLASVHVDTTPGPVDAVALHRWESQARAVADAQVERARAARRVDRPQQWMLPPPPGPAGGGAGDHHGAGPADQR